MDKPTAAEIIGVSTASVDLWARIGVLSRRFDGPKSLVRADEVEVMAAERRRWISIADAAALAGCSRAVIKSAVASGLIEVRPRRHRRQPSLSRESVDRFAAALPELRAESERRARRHEAEREQVRQERARRLNPPTPDGDRLSIVETAALLGVTANRVRRWLAASAHFPGRTSRGPPICWFILRKQPRGAVGYLIGHRVHSAHVSGRDVAAELAASGALDSLFVDADETDLTGNAGFISGVIKAALERGLTAELSAHLGYEKGSLEASLPGNSRTGTAPKTLASQVGPIGLAVRRDREGPSVRGWSRRATGTASRSGDRLGQAV